MTVNEMFLNRSHAIKLRLGEMRSSAVPQAIHSSRRSAVLPLRLTSRWSLSQVSCRRTEPAYPRELISVSQANRQTFQAAHGEPGYGTVVAFL